MPLHILVLTDRDWTHPQGGGTGANLYGQISRWLAWGHRVTVVACAYPGGPRHERIGALEIHRMGGRSTVFPRAIWKVWRGLGADADVVLEVVNGITFLTPLWLRKPCVTLVHHVHRDHYATELGLLGRVAAVLLETLPLRLLYRGSRFLTISEATADELAHMHATPRDQIEVNYIGVERAVRGGQRAETAQLLYLGRLKRYKRIELLLDVLEGAPGAELVIAGEGDHRPALEEEVDRRGLGERVRMLGHVSEQRKHELYAESWVNLTASSAGGWCLTVMEAAVHGTPSAALAVGGLPESIVDGHTGLLAGDGDGLTRATRRIVEDPELRERLGAAARERAAEFSWERTAERTLAVLEAERARDDARLPLAQLAEGLARSDTGRAAGLAVAVMAANVVALAFTVVFARLLGASGYGSLAVLVNAFLILSVPGTAVQAAVARSVSRAAASGSKHPAGALRAWLGRLLVAGVAVCIVSVMLREQVAAVLDVQQEWAAAAVMPAGFAWLVLSIERGTLQGLQRYRLVGMTIIGEAAARLGFGLLLYAAGLGVTGAFLGSLLSVSAMAAVVAFFLRPQLEADGAVPARAGALAASAWVPVAALTLLAFVQNVDVILVKHQAEDEAASSYAAAAVLAKGIIWIALGLALYLLPEAARRTLHGQDARPILVRTLGLIGLVAAPMVLLYAVASEPVLRLVFGDDLTLASDALPVLGLAMSLLAGAYLAVHYLLALHQVRFLVVLAAAALAEAAVVLALGADVEDVALGLLALQLFLAGSVLALSFSSAAHPSRARAA
jgi:glycosyltransferase involved in cell wall biosynthesis/O-antigen/teichoic acid export membrane protein